MTKSDMTTANDSFLPDTRTMEKSAIRLFPDPYLLDVCRSGGNQRLNARKIDHQ